jgi:hypothetical protein
LIYLGSPFSHADPAVRRWRYEQVSRFTVELLKSGVHAFSPIVYGFEMAERFGLCGSWEFWERLDLEFLSLCKELRVYMLPGWRESKGLSAEIQFAENYGIPITFAEADA